MTVSIHSQPRQLPSGFRMLLEQADARDFFVGARWLDAFHEHELEENAEHRIYCAEVDGTAAAALSLCTPAARAGSRFRKRWIPAASLSSATSFQSCAFGPLLCDDVTLAEKGLRAIFQYLAKHERQWAWVDLNGLDRDAPWFEPLVESLRKAGYVVRPYPHFPSRYETYRERILKDYLARRSPEDRKQFQNYERKWRKLQRENAAEFRIVRGPGDDIDDAVAAYRWVHERSWKQPERSPAFIPRIISEAFQAGVLRMGILRVDGQPVAVEVGIAHDRGVTMLKTAYDQAFRDRSVGAIAILRTIEHLIEKDHVEQIDFGRDDEPYKRLWMPHRWERWGVAAFNPASLAGLIGLSAQVRDDVSQHARALAKHLLRRSSAATGVSESPREPPG